MSKRQPKRSHRLPHGEGSFYWNERLGIWVGAIEAGWTASGRRRRLTVSSKNEDIAWDKLQAKRKRILIDGIPREGRGGVVTVKTWVTDHLKERRTALKPDPWASERSAIERWVIPVLGHRRLADLTPKDVRLLGDRVIANNPTGSKVEGRELTTTMARYVQRTFQLYMRAAAAEGHPVSQAVLEAKKRGARPSPRKALPLADAVAVLQAAHQRPDHSRWDAAFLQGMRQGEALGLTWDHVDFVRGTLTIEWTLQEWTRDRETGLFVQPDGLDCYQLDRRFWNVEPKTATSRRAIPMIPAFVRSLQAWRAVAPASPHNLVWPRPNGMPRISRADREEFKALQMAAEVTKPGGGAYTVHEARHSTVSILLEVGTPREVIEAIVGHSDLVESYITVSDERVERALRLLGDALRLES